MERSRQHVLQPGARAGAISVATQQRVVVRQRPRSCIRDRVEATKLLGGQQPSGRAPLGPGGGVEIEPEDVGDVGVKLSGIELEERGLTVRKQEEARRIGRQDLAAPRRRSRRIRGLGARRPDGSGAADEHTEDGGSVS